MRRAGGGIHVGEKEGHEYAIRSSFSCEHAQNSRFSLYEAEQALEAAYYPLGSYDGKVAQGNENTLKIMLGIALCRQDKALFQKVVENLGSSISPFSSDFN